MRVVPDPGRTQPIAAKFALPVDFMKQNWRQRPLHLPGGAAGFLPHAPSRAEIQALIAAGTPHQTDGATVWFLEGLTSGLRGIETLVAAARDWLEWRDVWCDVFLTVGRSSIGSHYDSSDNFTLQLTGNKTWLLGGPEGIHPEDRRRRILGEPGLGAAAMAAAPSVFDVRAGDALYIPSNWIHWGLSDGDSTSVSLVINVATPLHALHGQMLSGLRRDPAWSSPLPVGPGSSRLRDSLLRDLVGQDVPERLQEAAFSRVTDRNGAASSLKGRLDVSRTSPSTDSSWAAAYFQRVPASPDETFLDHRRMHGLIQLRAHRNLRRLIVLSAERYGRTEDDDARRIYSAVNAMLRAIPHDMLDSLLNDPELCSWLTLAERDTAMAAERWRVEDPLAHALGLIVLPDLAPHLSVGEMLTLDVATDEDGCVTLRRAGTRLLFPDAPRRVTLCVTEHGFQRCGPGGVKDADAWQETTAVQIAADGTVLTTEWSDWLCKVASWPALGAAVHCASLAELFDSALKSINAVGEPASHRHSFIPWVLIRGNVTPPSLADDHPFPGLPGLPLLNASAPGQWALAISAATARAEFDVIAEALPLFEEGMPSPSRRKVGEQALRHRYVRARLREWRLPLPAPDSNRSDEVPERESHWLSPWGRTVMDRIHQGRTRHP